MEESGTDALESEKREGGREAEKAVCRSPPFHNQIVYCHNAAIAAVFH